MVIARTCWGRGLWSLRRVLIRMKKEIVSAHSYIVPIVNVSRQRRRRAVASVDGEIQFPRDPLDERRVRLALARHHQRAQYLVTHLDRVARQALWNR